jgi:nucleolar complex protein 3
VSVPHFNGMHDVLDALIPHACGRDARSRQYACAALASLLARQQHSAVSVEAVQMVADAVRRLKCLCHPDVVHALLTLDFKDLTRDDVEKGTPLSVCPC